MWAASSSASLKGMRIHQHVYRWLLVLNQCLEEEYSRWILWMPVAIGSGMAFYFSLTTQPSTLIFWLSCVLCLSCACLLFVKPLWLRFLMRGLCLATLGFCLAHQRVLSLDPHPLLHSLDPLFLEGSVVRIDHYASSTQLFQKVLLKDIAPSFLPKAISVSIRTQCLPLQEGDRLRLKVDVKPLSPPCIPGGFDPQRYAFFQGIGASGFALTCPQISRAEPSTISCWRHTLTRRLHAELAPPFGSVACSFVTGDMASIPPEIRNDFAASGLSHILGLHLSIVMGFCCLFLYRLLAWIPYAALYINLQKISAALSLAIGWLYLKISGEGYPARRSFFMTALALIAMILSRKPVSMRSVMICATLIFLTEPEAILSLSFQLTFGAVISLICFYERPKPFVYQAPKKGMRLWVHKIFQNSVLPTTTVTLLTLPTLTFYFQQCSLQSIFSNLLAIPLTSVAIIPLGILALFSLALPDTYSPFFFTPWIVSLKALTGIAHLSATYLPFLYFPILPYHPTYFFLQLFGSFWILLWQKKWRWYGLIPLLVGGFFSITQGWRPVFLYNADQNIFAYTDPVRRTLWVSSKRKGRITAQRWGQAFGCPNVRAMDIPCIISLPNKKKIYFSQTLRPQDGIDMYICSKEGDMSVDKPVLVLDRLSKGQSYAIGIKNNTFVLTESVIGNRPWTVRPKSL